MTWPRSLQARLGLSLGILLTILWIAAASVTAVVLRHEISNACDSSCPSHGPSQHGPAPGSSNNST
jgi:hypothetical protein